jgi:hypothetical protein
MKTLNDIAAQKRAEARKTETEAAGLEKLNASGAFEGLPVQLAYADTVRMFKAEPARSKFAVSMEVQTRAEAVAIIDTLTARGVLLPCALTKGTFTRFQPETDAEADESAKEITGDLWPACWEVTPYRGGPQEAQLRAFAEVEDVRVTMRIKITQDPAMLALERARRMGTEGEILSENWTGLPNGGCVRYASGDAMSPRSLLYYFHQEPGAGPTLGDYLGASVPQTFRR